MNSLPEFRSYFQSTSRMACFSGIILLKSPKDFSLFDYILIVFGITITINNVVITSFLVYFLATQSYSLLELVTYIPFIVYATEGVAKYFFLMMNRQVYHGLLDELKELYATTWKYDKRLMDELDDNRIWIRKYQWIFVMQHSLFTYAPVLITAINYWFFGNWNPIRVLNIWYPFDVERHWLFVYWIEINGARYSAFNTILPDCLMLMMLIQMNYHFECLGRKIVEIVKEKKDHIAVKIKDGSRSQTNGIGSLKEVVQIHNKLME